MLVTVGLATIFEQLALLNWGPQFHEIPPLVPGNLVVGIYYINYQILIGSIIALTIGAVVSMFLKRTNVGKAIRMVAFDRENAKVLGIDVRRVSVTTFAVGGATAGLAGAILSAQYPLYPSVGWPIVIIAVIVVILGGAGSIKGTMIAGIIYALAQNITGFFEPNFASIVGLAVLIVFLLVKPTGIFGQQYVERA